MKNSLLQLIEFILKSKTLTLQEAMHMVRFREMFLIFWKEWEMFIHVDTDALQYLVDMNQSITLPNVKTLTEEQKAILKSYKGFVKI
jgi:hypothetical protein